MFRIPVDKATIADFCRRWHITEFSLFGSVLRDDFRPDSDVDVLVVFAPDTELGWEDWEAMEQELEAIFGRPVDLVEKEAVRNPFRRRDILKTHQVVYAA
ncbi:MAG TPA: nucleotidyltransferase domain-containing protein [Longimicrobiaceae bacterium]|nr:nucleotidyltransferase domain-containing protein [Longimicrobiaceae bacterium]